jgi:BirA family biotin operon repressor/biotin-[acetyl-CoA-carboxylase] ligase
MKPTLFELQSTESTHSLCAALGPRLEGELLVLAGVQTAGRGRRGRAWVSTKGNLHASWLTSYPALALPGAPSLAGLALATLLESEYGLACQVKWPNDVLVDEQKLAGILCASAGGRLLVSLGVNLVEPQAEGNPIPAANEVSGSGALRPCWLGQFGLTPSPLDLALGFLARFSELAELALREGRFPVELWNRHWGHLGALACASTPGGPVRGLLRGVDARGALLLERDDGTLSTITCDEVIHLRREQGHAAGH